MARAPGGWTVNRGLQGPSPQLAAHAGGGGIGWWSAIVSVVASVAGVGCGTTTEPEPVVLRYEAASFVITEGGESIDALQEGASLEINMREGGFTTGSLFMPMSVTGAGDLTADLAGTWVQRRDTVQFDHSTTTFVSEVAWVISAENLSTSDSYDGAEYDVVLVRVF